MVDAIATAVNIKRSLIVVSGLLLFVGIGLFGPAAQACVARLARTTTTRCYDVQIQDPYKTRVQIQHCQHSDHSGAFVILDLQRSGPPVPSTTFPHESRLPLRTLADCVGQPLYRVRITGNEIFHVWTEQTDPQTTRAEYELQTQGAFHAEILQLYSNFSFCDHTPQNYQLLVATHQWHITEAAAGKSQSAGPFCKAGNCALCAPGPLHGRWIANQSFDFVAQLVKELERTYVAGAPSAVVGPQSNITRSSVVDSSLLRWQPFQECTIDPTPQAIRHWGQKCSASSLLCVAGDSQMRHIVTQMDAIMTFKTIPYSNVTIRTIPLPEWGRLITVKMGDEVESTDFGNCSGLAINIGQWPMSTYAGDRPWTIQQYYQVATSIIETILRKAPHLQGNIAWVSTHPRGLKQGGRGRIMSHGREWISDPYLHQINEAMRAYCQAQSVKYVDTLAVLDAVSDLSYDSSHYLGTPGHWAAAMLLHAMCT